MFEKKLKMSFLRGFVTTHKGPEITNAKPFDVKTKLYAPPEYPETNKNFQVMTKQSGSSAEFSRQNSTGFQPLKDLFGNKNKSGS